jgi:hypothetical protein
LTCLPAGRESEFSPKIFQGCRRVWGNFWLENSGIEFNFEKIYILQTPIGHFLNFIFLVKSCQASYV